MKGRRGKERSSRFSTTVSSMASSSSPSSLLSSISSMTSALASATSSRSGRFDVTDRTKGCCGHKRQRGLIHYQYKRAALLTTSCFCPNVFHLILTQTSIAWHSAVYCRRRLATTTEPDLDTLSMDFSSLGLRCCKYWTTMRCRWSTEYNQITLVLSTAWLRGLEWRHLRGCRRLSLQEKLRPPPARS